MSQRLSDLQSWLCRVLESDSIVLTPASTDASFRHYYRIAHQGGSLIAMDAPPDKEDTAPFIQVAGLLNSAGLHAPRVLSADAGRGFLLLSDLGTEDYLSSLSADTVEALYGDALQALYIMQTRLTDAARTLPDYDREFLYREMELFRDWYLHRYRGLELSDTQQTALETVFDLLAECAVHQPQVFVHRDYHSRNLMRVADNNPGILDFQDAMYGPVTYDLVSLLRDCYIRWPRPQVEAWALAHLQRLQAAGIVPGQAHEQELLQWFDWMGVQRHLKAAGIFARLSLRDDKHGYLSDIPRTLGYVTEVCTRYDALAPLAGLLSELPA